MYPGLPDADRWIEPQNEAGQGEPRWQFRSGSDEAAGAVRDAVASPPVLVVERRSFVRTVARRVVGPPDSRPARVRPQGRPHSVDRPAVPGLRRLPGLIPTRIFRKSRDGAIRRG